MWKWLLFIIIPFIILAIFEETANYIIYRLTGEKRERRFFKKKVNKSSRAKNQSHGTS